MPIFKNLTEKLDEAETADDLLEIAFYDYINHYYHPCPKPSERNLFLEQIIRKIHKLRTLNHMVVLRKSSAYQRLYAETEET